MAERLVLHRGDVADWGFRSGTQTGNTELDDRAGRLKTAGVFEIYNLYAKAGTGFAQRLRTQLEAKTE